VSANGGTIRRLEFSFDDTDPQALADLFLSAQWDPASGGSPAIELPLSLLFAATPAPASFHTLPMSVEVNGAGGVFTLRLPMPFVSGASLLLSNRGVVDRELVVRIDGSDGPPPPGSGRLHAQVSERFAPVTGAHRFVVADLQGKGKYVGTLFAFQGTRQPDFVFSDPFNFLEGDETAIIDGELAVHGTGTEEFVNGGFYFVEGRFDFPFSALIATDTEPLANGEIAGRARAVRWHVLSDAIRYQNSFHLEFEYGANRPETMLHYWAVALYYQE
jgi:hypothetical protein